MYTKYTPNAEVQWPQWAQQPGAQPDHQISNNVASLSIHGMEGQALPSLQHQARGAQQNPYGPENQGRHLVAQLQILPQNTFVNQSQSAVHDQNRMNNRDEMASSENQGPQHPGMERERQEDPATLDEVRRDRDGRHGSGGPDGPVD